MNTKTSFTRNILSAIWALTILLLCFGESYAQTYFPEVTIPADAAPNDYLTIATFSTPAGTGTSRKTIARIVTPTIPAGQEVMFEITPPAGKKSAQITVDGNTGFVEVDGTGEPVTDLVKAEVISDPPDNAPVASGFVIVRVTIEYHASFDFGGSGETWNLKAKEMTTARSYMGFVGTGTDDPATPLVNEIDALVTKPKISIAESELNFGEVQEGASTNVAPVLPVTIRNVGTAPLTITGAPISNNPSPVFFEVAVFAGIPPLNPGAQIENIFDEDASDGTTDKKGLWIMAHPGALEERTSSLTVQSSDVNMNVPLRVKGVSLYAHLLVDISGSMGWKPDGSDTTVESEKRLTQAKQAGKELNNWINEFSGRKAYLGLSAFPGHTQTGNSSVVVSVDRTINNHGSINVAFGPESLNGLLPWWNGTPMSDGFHAAVNDMNAGFGKPGLPRATDIPNLRQAILLLSDGAANVDSISPPITPRDWITPLKTKGIRTYTIGYGVPNASNVDWQLLQDIAAPETGTNGQFFDANALDPFALKNAFKSAVREWLGLRPVVDPTGTIRAGISKSHDVCIDESAQGVSFVIDWDRHIPGGINFTLKTPKGQTITPSSSGVSFSSGDTYAMYIIRGSRIRGGQGAGEWTLQLTGGNALPVTEDTIYSYSVLVQSKIEMAPKFYGKLLYTAQSQLLEVQLSGIETAALKQGKASINYDIPSESWGTYISTGKIDPSWIVGPGIPEHTPESMTKSKEKKRMRVPDTIMGEPATLVQKKAYALEHLADNPFHNKRSQGTIQLYDDGTNGDKVAGDGIYSNYSPKLAYDGIYNISVLFEAVEAARSCVHREELVSTYVSVKLTPELVLSKTTWKDVEVTPYFDMGHAKILAEKPPSGFERKSVVFTPQDEFDNYWGPGKADQIKFNVKNAEPLGTIVDNLDGSYIQVVQYKKGANPSVTVTARDVTSPEIQMGVEEKPCKFPVSVWIILGIIIFLLIIVIVLIVIFRTRKGK